MIESMNQIELYKPLLDSEALRYFEMVARCGNVTRAAERLNRTQEVVGSNPIVSTNLFRSIPDT